MDKFLEELNKFSNREKLLLGILAALVLEVIIYFFVFSPKVRELNSLSYESEIIQSDINTSNKMLDNIENMKLENEELINSNRTNEIVYLDEENIKKLKNDFPGLEVYDNGDGVKNFLFYIEGKDLPIIKDIFNKYPFNSMQIHKESEGLYKISSTIITNKSSSIVPKIVKSEEVNKNADLKSYLSSRMTSKSVGKANNVEVRSQVPRSDSNRNFVQKQNILVNSAENSVVEHNVEVANSTPSTEYENILNKLDFDFEKFILLSNENNLSNIILTEDKNSFMVYYDLFPEIERNELYVIFNEILNFKEFSFKIYTSSEFNGEFGVFTHEKTPSPIKIIPGEENQIIFKDLKNFKGFYYKINSKDPEKGVMTFYDFRGQI